MKKIRQMFKPKERPRPQYEWVVSHITKGSVATVGVGSQESCYTLSSANAEYALKATQVA